MIRLIISIFLASLVSGVACAEVVKSAADGFIIQHNVSITHDKAKVFQTMTDKVGDWWNPDHSFSGNSGNMLIDADCFCERWDGNLVRHLNTTIWLENSKVVMQGGLGPLKELGLDGTMVWSVSSAEEGGTNLSWKYYVNGFSEADLINLATVVDGVLKEQIGRLLSYMN